MPPFPQAEAEAPVETAFGKPCRSCSRPSDRAVAAASIAQVHRAEHRDDGRPQRSR